MFAVIGAITDPEWAAPINTLFLILLTVYAGRGQKKLVQNANEIDTVSKKVDSAAVAAAAAAEAAADAARIAKDIGGQARYRVRDDR